MTTTTRGDEDLTQPIPPPADAERGRGGPSLKPAPVPRRSPGAGYLGIVLAVLVLGLGVFVLYEGIVQAGWADGGTPVLTEVLTGPAVVGAHALTATVGVLLALVGLWLLWTSLRPSRHSGVAVGGSTGTWMTHEDLEKIAVGTAEDCDGVLSARARAGRKRLDVRARTTTDEVRDVIRSAVEDRLTGMPAAPRVHVRVEPTVERKGDPR